MKKIKCISIIILVLLIAISVTWQMQYEKSITEIKLNCSSFNNLKRLKYTPVILYKFAILINRDELRKDRMIGPKLTNDCKKSIMPGYVSMYIAHTYLTAHQKDSLLILYKFK